MNSENQIAKQLIKRLKEKHFSLSGAESCTGGLVSSHITAIPGASEVFSGSIVSYTNKVKHAVLGVSEKILEVHGAVSEECVREMAAGAAAVMHTETAFSVSGFAGPGGGTEDKPVGTICFGYYINGNISAETVRFNGNRNDIRAMAAAHVLKQLELKLH